MLEGKTDYQARKALIVQDKNKYNSPKYRLVVRFTNTDVIAQIVYSKIVGDIVLASAYSHELPKYGINLGLTNYAAAYATGLLLARRVLTKLGLADKYVGVEEATGEEFYIEEEEGARPFYVLLDTGLPRTTTGNRVFGALKGAIDGGLEIPYSVRRFVGYSVNKEDPKQSTFDPSVMRKYIFGGHVADHMTQLQEEDAEAYQKKFSRYIKAGIKPSDLEGIYKKAHAEIRKNPTFEKKDKKPVQPKRFNLKKLTLEERQERVKARLAEVGRS